MLINEIGKMSNLGPTSGVEAYYSVVNHFAPKMYKFSYKGMISRILLAAMHYNENAGRALKVTRQGKKCYSIVYPKYKNGGYSQRKVLVNSTYEYANECFLEVMNQAKIQKHARSFKETTVPPHLSSATANKPEKKQAIAENRSHFIKRRCN